MLFAYLLLTLWFFFFFFFWELVGYLGVGV